MEEYLMTTDFTAAPSALISIINHFNPKFKLNKENEFKTWMSSANLPTRGSSIFGLAIFAKENNLNPKIIIEKRKYEYPDYRFKGYKKIEIQEAEFSRSIHIKKAAKLDIPIEQLEIDFELIDDLVEKGKILLLRTNAGIFRDTGSISNYIVIYNKKNSLYQIIDPKIGKLDVTKEEIEKSLETLHSKKKRSPKMLIF